MSQNSGQAPSTHSPELTGGAGFTFEDACMATYLAALLNESTAPGLTHGVVVKVSSQQAAFGEPLDDVIVDAGGADGEVARLSLQVKRELRIGSAADSDFRDIVVRSYATMQKPGFGVGRDRVGSITGTMSDASKRAMVTVCEWARDQADASSFLLKFKPGISGQQHRDVLEHFRAVLRDIVGADIVDAEVFHLLRHFILIKLDLLNEGAIDESNIVAGLRTCLPPGDANRVDDLWSRLRLIARESAGRAAVFDRSTLVARLYGSFRLDGALSFRRSLSRLSEEARFGLVDITTDIAGFNLPRRKCVEEVKAASVRQKFVQIVGLPGTGKSAVLRVLAEENLRSGPMLFLKADRLMGQSWGAYAKAIGLDNISLESLLLEIAVCGVPVLGIDGLDRIEVNNRGIVVDIVNTILCNAILKSAWSMVVTVRNGGIEDIRTWLPRGLFGETGAATVEVKPFDDEESKELAEAMPTLRPLLFGDERIREISRRPFFASVLGKAIGVARNVASTSNSEIQLIDAWWARGGYNADPRISLRRQRALVQLAEAGAMTFGRGMKLASIDPEAVAELREDGVLKDALLGHTVKFSHDIFFEWAFLQFLIGREADWPLEIRIIGEPPVLGRIIELLSQNIFYADRSWGIHLSALENSDLRPQWARAWVLGPLGNPNFQDRAETYSEVIFHGGGGRFKKLANWFQAEKTRANPQILDGSILKKALPLREVIRLADMLAWPSDMGSWTRCCQWILQNIARCPIEAIPDIVSVFEVWQNALVDIPNPISRQMMAAVHSWLIEIEDVRHPEEFRIGDGRWGSLPEGGAKELEERLRALFLRCARIFPNDLRTYIKRVSERARLRRDSFEQFLLYSPILSQSLPSELVDLFMAEVKKDLPEDVAARPRDGSLLGQSFSHYDWHNLALNEHTGCFFPASPLRQPFPALFEFSPQDGLRVVRDLANHAITAWRQLFKLDWEYHRTPIPLTLDFPWGQQTFWGTGQIYTWFRANGAPDVVETGLMALENWAFLELQNGRDADEIIKAVIIGHESCAVLGIAVAIALKAQKVSPVTLPLVISQHLWVWDIQRLVLDQSGSANMVGFQNNSDEHAEAVRNSNARDVRKQEIRSLVMLFVLSGDQELRDAAQNAIQAFPEKLPLEFEEERQDLARIKSLRDTAEFWAEVGKAENYSVFRIQDDDKVLVEHQNPRANDPDMVASMERHQALSQKFRLLTWARDSLSKNVPSEKIDLSRAIEVARALEVPESFTQHFEITEDGNFNRCAIAATAAVALKFASNISEDESKWAEGVTFRAMKTPEMQDDEWLSRSVDPFHVCLFATQGLGFLVRNKQNALEAKKALIQLTAHPREQISEAAIGSILRLWETDSDFSWEGLNLAIKLAVMYWTGHRDESRALEKENRSRAINAALSRVGLSQTEDFTLHDIPSAWVFATPKRRGASYTEVSEGELQWQEPVAHLDHAYLAKVLPAIPFQLALKDARMAEPFLKFCRTLVDWTLDRIAPTWDRGSRRRRESEVDLFRWKSDLYQFLGRVALCIDADLAKEFFLSKVFQIDDEESSALLCPFVDMLVCAIMDEPIFPDNAATIIQDCIPCFLENDDWKRARARGGRLYGDNISQLTRTLLFVQLEKDVPGCARFANGDWTEITKILPIVDAIIRSVGDIPLVASAFLTLCERASAHYPIEKFLEQMGAIFALQTGTPVGWRGTRLSSRIASLIQIHAELAQPLPSSQAKAMLRLLDILVDMGDRRATALQASELFKNIAVT